jgi:hypothetical protein
MQCSFIKSPDDAPRGGSKGFDNVGRELLPSGRPERTALETSVEAMNVNTASASNKSRHFFELKMVPSVDSHLLLPCALKAMTSS